MESFPLNKCRSETGNTSYTMEDYTGNGLVSVIVPTIFAFVVAIGLFGNLLVIIVVTMNKNMRNTTNTLIANLAVADLAFIIICVPFTAFKYTTPVWPFGGFWCKFMHYTMYTCAWASIYTLVLMSFDRFLAVVFAVPSMKWRTSRNAGIACLVMWVIMLSVNVPAIMNHDLLEMYYLEGEECKSFDTCEFSFNATFVTCFLVFGYILPLALVCLLYGAMLKRLLSRKSPGCKNGKQSNQAKNSKKRATRLVIVIVSIFAICWLPIHIVYITVVYGLQQETTFQVVFNIMASVLAYINSCVNPILYAFLSDKFRDSFKKILCCGSMSRTHQPIPVTHSTHC